MKLLVKTAIILSVLFSISDRALARNTLCDSDGFFYSFTQKFLQEAPSVIENITNGTPVELNYGIRIVINPSDGTAMTKDWRELAGSFVAVPANTHGNIEIEIRSHAMYMKQIYRSAWAIIKSKIKHREMTDDELFKISDSSSYYNFEYTSTNLLLSIGKQRLMSNKQDGGRIFYSIKPANKLVKNSGKYSLEFEMDGGVHLAKTELSLKWIGLKDGSETPTFYLKHEVIFQIVSSPEFQQQITKQTSLRNKQIEQFKCNE